MENGSVVEYVRYHPDTNPLKLVPAVFWGHTSFFHSRFHLFSS